MLITYNPIVIIQARTNSTRLPNKVLLDIKGRPLIEHVISQVQLTGIPFCIAIPKNDDKLKDYFLKRNRRFFEGSEIDVLDRYYNCAKSYEANPIIRITSDCYAVLPETIYYLTSIFTQTNFDFISNTFKPRTVFEGNDVEVISWKCLKWLYETVKDQKYREHVTNFIYENKDLFSKAGFKKYEYRWNINLSNIKTSIDTQEDLDRANEVK